MLLKKVNVAEILVFQITNILKAFLLHSFIIFKTFCIIMKSVVLCKAETSFKAFFILFRLELYKF